MRTVPNLLPLFTLVVALLPAGCGKPSFESERDTSIALFKDGKFQEAADQLLVLSEEGKSDFQTRYYLARSYEGLSDFNSALHEWKAVLLIRPAFAEAYYRQGNCLVNLKRREEALASWQEALRIQPGYKEASFNCAVTYEQMKMYDEAVQMYTRTIVVDSTFMPAQHNLGRLLNLAGEWELALPRYKSIRSADPENTGAHMNIIVTLMKLDRREEALMEIERYIAEHSPSELELDSLSTYRARIESR